MKMPHGKFKDHEIEDLPSWYLEWIAKNFDESSEPGKTICEKADIEWRFRQRYDCHKD